MSERARLIGLLVGGFVILGLAAWGMLSEPSNSSGRPSDPRSEPRSSEEDSERSSDRRSRALEGCPIELVLEESFRRTSSTDPEGWTRAVRHAFASEARPFDLSITCYFASHNVEKAPSRFLDRTTRRMARLLPGGSPERTRISAGPVPGWRFVARPKDRIVVGLILVRGVRVVLLQTTAPASRESELEAWHDRLLSEGVRWTVE